MRELKRNRSIFIFFVFVFVFLSCCVEAQKKEYAICSGMFYNVENLFDTQNDSAKNDEEFLPKGSRHWTNYKYHQKLINISRVIYESGGWSPPIFIGLCEVENERVIKDLIWKTGLKNLNYKFIHYESPDQRGIDVALLYRYPQMKIKESYPIQVKQNEDSRPTRDILYVDGLLFDSIEVHLFVNHWPSRYGGLQETRKKRLFAASVLIDSITKVLSRDDHARVIVMGDFNDEPTDESVMLLCNEKHGSYYSMVNLSKYAHGINGVKGTIKHQHQWSIFDQFIVSESLMDTTKNVFVDKEMKILDFPFLLEDDDTYMGKRLKRTYFGYKYHSGFSDHLPVWINLKVCPIKM